MSYWNHRKPVRRARAVDVGDIAREAGALLDEGGIRALTVRAVATRLGVAAASLYSRVESADDLLDLALDDTLGRDPADERAGASADIQQLMLAFYRHLTRHPWTPHVIGLRAPRGPNYLRLSERMCMLLSEDGAADPLGTAYAMSNFVIGSAATAPMVHSERDAPVDAELAPMYARLHAEHAVDAEAIVRTGLAALHQNGRG